MTPPCPFFTVTAYSTTYYLLPVTSARRPGKTSAGQHMKMQMLNRLSAVLAAIIDYSEALFEAVFLSELRRHLENMRNNRTVGRIDLHSRRNVFLRDYEHMKGRLRCNILKGKHLIVLINLGAGNIRLLSHKKTGHFISPFHPVTAFCSPMTVVLHLYGATF